MIRAVTLDAAGTLFAPREPVGTTYARVAREAGLSLAADDAERGFRRAMAAAPPLAFPGGEPAASDRLERDWWRAVVRTAFGQAAGASAFPACFDALYEYYACAEAWTVFDDVIPALRALHTAGLRVGVVSNFDGRLPILLDALGLMPAIDAVVWSTAAGAAKPQAAIFARAAAELGVDLAELCHVGDDLDTDVLGARAAGAHGLHLDRRGRAADAVTTLLNVPRCVSRDPILP